MKIYNYILIIFLQIICPFNSSASTNGDDIWDDFQKAQQTGSVTNAVDYVQSLYTLTSGLSTEDLFKRKEAILYFLTTGGKYGFRETPATSEERVILENALIFCGLSDAAAPYPLPVHDLTQLRRWYGFKEEDERIQVRLALVQKYYTYGCMIGLWHRQHNPNVIKIIFSQNYVLPRLVQEFKNGQQTGTLQSELDNLKDDFTPALVQRVSVLWKEISKINSEHLDNKGPFQEQDVTGLVPVITGFKNIIRDSLAYAVPLRWITASSSEEAPRPSSLRRTARPWVVILRDGTIVIRRADGSFFSQGSFSHSGGGESIRSENNAHIMSDKTEKELLELLTRETSLVTKFYVGESNHYVGLTSKDVWVETLPVYRPWPTPTYREAPNTELIKQLAKDSIQKCEEGIRNLELPQYKSPFINNAALTKTLSKLLGHLQTLFGKEEGSEDFTDYCQQMKNSLEFVFMNFDHPPMESFGSESMRSRASRLQARSIMKMAYNALRGVHSYLDHLQYLSAQITIYSSLEFSEETDVLPTDLPSHAKIEEGEADITRSGNTLEITVKTDGTVITFEDFWVGSDANVLVHLPSEKATVSIYQRSRRSGYVFGEIEHSIGFLNLYFPHASRWSSLNMDRMKSVSGKSYQPKSSRRYPVNLEGRQTYGGGDKVFDRFNGNRDQDDRDTNPEFWQTPEGKFEQEWAVLNQGLGEAPDAIAQSRGLLAIAKRYKQEGYAFAAVRVAQFEHDLAYHLYQKAQTVPGDEQYSLIEEAVRTCEGESDCKEFFEKRANLQAAFACWFQKDGVKTRETDFDRTCNQLRKALELMRTAEKMDSMLRSNRETVEQNFTIIVTEKIQEILKSPTTDGISQAEKLLHEAESLESSWKSGRVIQDLRVQLVRAKMPKRVTETVSVTAEAFPASVAFVRKAPKTVEQDAESTDKKVAEMIDAIKRRTQHPTALRGFLRSNPASKDEKYLDLYKSLLNDDTVLSMAKEGLIEAYPHADLVCLYLQKTKIVSQLYLRQLVSDVQFMKEKAIGFFTAFCADLRSSDKAIILEAIKASPHAHPDLINAVTQVK